MKKKIAFIKLRSFSHTNEQVKNQLVKNFPSYQVEAIDVFDLFKYKTPFVINLFFLLREYGPAILSGKKRVRDCFFMTTYFFKLVKSTIPKKISDDRYVFSIQTQSQFDASRKGLPHFVYTDHTYLANRYYPNFDKINFCPKTVLEQERTIYNNAAINFTMSSNISRSLIDQYCCPTEKVVCVYAGRNASVDQIEREDKDYGNKTVLFVGKDWERKGGPQLLKAFKMVLGVCPEAKLVIVGCSPKTNIENCEVVGKVDRKEVVDYYREASIFCLPTKAEPFGIVFLEAMACKLPVVGTRIGALPDFISHGRNGYLVDDGNVKQLAEALIDLIKDPVKCRDFGNKGLEIVQNRYNWDSVGIRLKENIEPFLKN